MNQSVERVASLSLMHTEVVAGGDRGLNMGERST